MKRRRQAKSKRPRIRLSAYVLDAIGPYVADERRQHRNPSISWIVGERLLRSYGIPIPAGCSYQDGKHGRPKDRIVRFPRKRTA